MLARKALAGTAGAPKLYVEDVMSCFLYTGNGSTQTITNNIDLSTEGGLVWFKSRAFTYQNILSDTVNGAGKFLISDATNALGTDANDVTAFNTTGFSIGNNNRINYSGSNFVSWTFRKAEKFFDVVTYTGTGSARTVSHNLGSVPGCIIIKQTNTSGADWAVFHRSQGKTKYGLLNTTAAFASDAGNTRWNNTDPTSTDFTVGSDTEVNANGSTYVAYLFAHDAGGFGDAGSDSIIKCGSYTGNGSSTGPTVTLDWEPQWVMIKDASGTGNWCMFDSMRGLTVSDDKSLYANTSNAEDGIIGTGSFVDPTATGFNIVTTNGNFNDNGNTFIYIAIRRGPMKTPTAGTAVFQPTVRTGTGATASISGLAFPPDLVITRNRPSNLNDKSVVFDKLRGVTKYLITSGTDAEATGATTLTSFNQTGESFGDAGLVNGNGDSYINWQFLRAPGFFDVVCYTGTGANRTVSHGLGVTPELMIVKTRGPTVTNGDWAVYNTTNGNTKIMYLNATSASATSSVMWNNTSPTSSVFTVGTDYAVNYSGDNYVAYLFASVSGVSKVGSYTGNGSSVTVTTDFQPRFVMVKRYDSTGNWIVGDSARGLVSADEPALFLNSAAAETTGQDWVDVSSTGFTVNETALNANVNTGTYIYLAIA